MMNEKKPWLDENGVRRSEGEIRSLAEKWGDKTWEEFLKDTVEKPLKDTLLKGLNYETIEAQVRETYQEMISTDFCPDLVGLVEMLINHLTIRERCVVHSLFWAGKSQSETAKELSLSKSSVRTYQNRALKKMGTLLIKNLMIRKASDSFSMDTGRHVFAQKHMGERRVS